MSDKDPAREAAEEIYGHVTDALFRRELLLHDDLEKIIRRHFAEELEDVKRLDWCEENFAPSFFHGEANFYAFEGDLRAAIDKAREEK